MLGVGWHGEVLKQAGFVVAIPAAHFMKKTLYRALFDKDKRWSD